MRALKIVGLTLATLVGLLVVAVVVLNFMNWNAFRPRIASFTKRHLGRELRIAGDLEAHLIGWCPGVSAEKIRFENAPWASKQPMLTAGRFAVSVCLPQLLKGDLHVKSLELVDARVLAEQDAKGRWNFALGEETGKKKEMKAEKEGKGEEAGRFELPVWEHVRVENVRVLVERPAPAERLTIKIDKIASERRSRDRPMNLTGKGEVQGMPFDVDANVRESNEEGETKGLAFETKAHLAEIALRSKGRVADMTKLDPVSGTLELTAKKVQDVARVLGFPLSGAVPTIELTTGFARDGRTIRVGTLDATMGASKLGGWVAVDLLRRPALRGVLRSPLVRVADLDGFFPKAAKEKVEVPKERKKKAEKTGKSIMLLPDTPISTAPLKAVDADLELTVDKIEGTGKLAMLDSASAKIALKNGKLRLEPARLGIVGGVVETKSTIDGSGAALATDVDVAIRKVDLKRLSDMFVPEIKVGTADTKDLIEGRLRGAVKLKSAGRSAHDLAAALDGDIGVEIEDGRISGALLEAAGADITQLLGNLVREPATKRINCMLASFKAEKGIIRTNGVFLGTPDSNIVVNGAIDLRQEALDLQMRTLPKDFSVGSLRTPFEVKGTFAHPKFEVKKGPLLARVAAAAGLGAALGPAAAIVPLIEPGTEKTGACVDYRAKIAKVREEAKAVGH